MVRWLVCVSAAMFVLQFASASRASSDDPARASLVAETDSFVPGQTAYIGIAFDIDDEWYLYWNGRNDTGFEPEIELTLPPGFEAGKTYWPSPKRKVSEGDLLDHIYEHSLLLMIPVTVPGDARPGEEFTIEATVDWLVCREACIPGTAQLKLRSRIAAPDRAPRATSAAARFREMRERMPKVLPSADPPVTLANERKNTWTIIARGAGKVAFYPARESAVLAHPIADAAADEDRLTLRLTDPEQSRRIVGIVELWPEAKGKKSTIWWIDTAPEKAASDAAPPPERPAGDSGENAPASSQ